MTKVMTGRRRNVNVNIKDTNILHTRGLSLFSSFGLLLNILLVVAESLYFLCLLLIATRNCN